VLGTAVRRYSAGVILAAGLLVLLGLGMFVAGVATGTTLLYWATVVACVVAAVLLVLARREVSAAARPERRPSTPPSGGPAAAPAETSEQPAVPATAAPVPPPAPPVAEPVPPPVTGPLVAPVPPFADRPADQPPSEPREEPAAAAVEEEPSVPLSAADRARIDAGEPPVEDVEVTDLLLVVDLKDDVYVVDEHPRYHLVDCPRLLGQEAIPFPLDEARTDGFTPCGICEPDRHMADVARARKAGRMS
jgi:type IV secretory pathway VirB10-like protein